jgi:acetyltransferase-like isoleucine patch superfamily enzyme
MYYAPIHLSTWAFGDAAPEVHVGAYTILNPGVRIIAAERVEVGQGVQLATGAYVTDADWHGIYHRAIPPGDTAPVVLEDNVWIADGARVLKGVTVGKNSVVAAGAVATKNVPANTIVAGNPARVVRELDPQAPATTRNDLFEVLDYVNFEREWQRDQLGDNSVLRWLRTLIAPRRDD